MGRGGIMRGLILLLAVVGLGRAESAAAGPAGTQAVTDTVEAGSEEFSAGEVRMLPKSFFAERAKERQGRMGRIVRKVGSGALGGVLGGPRGHGGWERPWVQKTAALRTGTTPGVE